MEKEKQQQQQKQEKGKEKQHQSTRVLENVIICQLERKEYSSNVSLNDNSIFTTGLRQTTASALATEVQKSYSTKTIFSSLLDDYNNNNNINSNDDTFTQSEIIIGYICVVSILVIFVITCPESTFDLRYNCSSSSVTNNTINTTYYYNIYCIYGYNILILLQICIAYFIIILSFIFIQGSNPGYDNSIYLTTTPTTNSETTNSETTNSETINLDTTNTTTKMSCEQQQQQQQQQQHQKEDEQSLNKTTPVLLSYKRIRKQRSYYCTTCKQYIIGYDHYCDVLHTCIGEKNRGRFFIFLVIQLYFLLLSLYYYLPMPIPFYYYNNSSSNNNNNKQQQQNNDYLLFDLFDVEIEEVKNECKLYENDYLDSSSSSTTTTCNALSFSSSLSSSSEWKLIIYFWIVHCTFYILVCVILFLLFVQSTCAILNVTTYELSTNKYKSIMTMSDLSTLSKTTCASTTGTSTSTKRVYSSFIWLSILFTNIHTSIINTLHNIYEYFYLTSYITYPNEVTTPFIDEKITARHNTSSCLWDRYIGIAYTYYYNDETFENKQQ